MWVGEGFDYNRDCMSGTIGVDSLSWMHHLEKLCIVYEPVLVNICLINDHLQNLTVIISGCLALFTWISFSVKDSPMNRIINPNSLLSMNPLPSFRYFLQINKIYIVIPHQTPWMLPLAPPQHFHHCSSKPSWSGTLESQCCLFHLCPLRWPCPVVQPRLGFVQWTWALSSAGECRCYPHHCCQTCWRHPVHNIKLV